MPALPAETAPAALDLRPVPGTVTGRSLDQLFLRRSAAVFVPLTGGPDPVALLSADMASGTATVQRAGGGRRKPCGGARSRWATVVRCIFCWLPGKA